VGNLAALQELILSQTQIGDKGLASISGLTGLASLDLFGTGVTDAGLKSLSSLANLRYNDYGLENPAKRKRLIALTRELQAQKVPLHAIGSQAHVNVSMSFETMDQALTEMATLGLPIHITELDVNSAQGGQRGFGANVADNAATTQGGLVSDADKKLADAFAGIFRAFVKHRDSVKMVTFWGVNDAVSWRAQGKPLLFDGNNQPKPAFHAVIAEAKKAAEAK
jgi:endo-1,4-beta-xylanase